MQLEWDEAKRLATIAKHGVDFRDLERFKWHEALAFPPQVIEGETRWREIGPLDDRLVYVVYTEREDRTRIISARVATKLEKKLYVENA
ncbi:MAG: BrnT family toxin [Pseudomonadota bacterium]